MTFTKKYNRKLNEGAVIVNEINDAYLRGDIDEVNKLNRKLDKICKTVQRVWIIHRARTLREG